VPMKRAVRRVIGSSVILSPMFPAASGISIRTNTRLGSDRCGFQLNVPLVAWSVAIVAQGPVL
jgi:hypothetical protein